MPIKLNYINIYSLDGSFSKSICLGKTPSNITTVIKTNVRNRIYTFSDLRVFDDFFGVVFINEKTMTYQTNRVKLPSILLFNWDGVPVAELKLESHITDFDIDFINKELYTFDLYSDEFFKYDIGNILSELPLN